MPTALPDLVRERALQLLSRMLLIRRFEEKAAEVYTLGRIRGFLHLYIGEEAVAVGAMQSLLPEDAIVATYREHGQALARGIAPGAVMAEMYGRANGCSRGRGGSMHLFDAAHRFYGGYAIVGGGLPIAVGLALADRMASRSSITACFFGEGAVAEGEFHESMNLAALWQLPLLFLCENNRYAMGTALTRSESQTDLPLKARAYGMSASTVDGMDVLAVEAAVREAADAVRRERAPRFLELRTYRFRAHSMSDPDLYRSRAEVEEWKHRCPIEAYARLLRAERILTDEGWRAMEAGVAREVDDAVRFAEAGALEPVADLARDVYTPRSEVPRRERAAA
ncbi:MAG TPA: pyruvate dehydrogenase (acetyl-transferring) E1 component subunit alpha [Casimicrobiaceae bacterium]|jgi:pyruvate dehydrogenase E1 component alpha subunit